MMPGQVGSNPFPVGGLESAMSATEQAEQKFSALMAALLAGAKTPEMSPVELELPVLLPDTPPEMTEAPPIDPTPSPVTTVGMTPVDPGQIVQDVVPTAAQIAPGCGAPAEALGAESASEQSKETIASPDVGGTGDEASSTPASNEDLPTLFDAVYAAMAQIQPKSIADGSAAAPADAAGQSTAANTPGMVLSRQAMAKSPTSGKRDASPAGVEAEVAGGVALDGLEALVEDLDIGPSSTVRPATASPKPEPPPPTAQDAVANSQPELPRPESVVQKGVSEAAQRFSVGPELPSNKARRETIAPASAEPTLYGPTMPSAVGSGAIPEPVEVRPAPMAQEPARQPAPTDRVTLHLPDNDGGTRIQIAVRGETVHTRIVASDSASAGGLERGMGELRDALARQGFQEQHVRVDTRLQVAEPRAPVEAGWAPAASRDSAGASNDRRQESDAREDAGRPDPREQQQHRSPNRDRRGRER